jgi:hypothetical protein
MPGLWYRDSREVCALAEAAAAEDRLLSAVVRLQRSLRLASPAVTRTGACTVTSRQALSGDTRSPGVDSPGLQTVITPGEISGYEQCGFAIGLRVLPGYLIFFMNSSTGMAGSVIIWIEPREPISTDIFMTVSLSGASTMFTKS